MLSFQNWVSLPENQLACFAVQRVVEGVSQRRARCSVNPLFLHGPSGTGKSHLVSALVQKATVDCPDLVVATLAVDQIEAAGQDEEDGLASALQADLVIVEDLQHLSGRVIEPLVRLIDRCQSRQRQLVVTATLGPAELTDLPGRLTSRLASGLVVGLLPLSPASRLLFLTDRARRSNLRPSREVLEWLAENLPGSGRILEGALGRLKTLARTQPELTVAVVSENFQTEAQAHRPTMERIARSVSEYFQVETRQLQSRDRSRDTLLPRQIGMYLARQLTGLSLEQIGDYFGGRDHSTVLHACRKVEQALGQDGAVSGAVRRLHAELV